MDSVGDLNKDPLQPNKAKDQHDNLRTSQMPGIFQHCLYWDGLFLWLSCGKYRTADRSYCQIDQTNIFSRGLPACPKIPQKIKYFCKGYWKYHQGKSHSWTSPNHHPLMCHERSPAIRNEKFILSWRKIIGWWAVNLVGMQVDQQPCWPGLE